ncbi:MAG TPA: NAD(P)H-binding protein [Streptosporangiaceae bacterium]
MIVVTGASGNVGGEVARALLDGGHKVRALTTGGEKGLPAGAEPVTGDLDQPSTLAAALEAASGIFLLPGFRDMPGVLAVAARSGLDRVVLLSGSSAGSGDLTNAISSYMIRSEEAVRASGLAWTILRPSAFMSNAFRWLPQLRAGDVVRLPFAGVPAAVIDPADIAAVAALALTADGHQEAVYRLTGPESLLPADQVAVLARVLGRPLRFEAQPDDEARTEMTAAMPAEYVDAFFRFYVDGELDESMVLPTVPRLIGRPARTFEQWAAAHAAAFA